MIYLDNKINIFTTKGMIKPNQLQSNVIMKNYQNKIQLIESINTKTVNGKKIVFDNGETFFLSEDNSLLTLDGIKKIRNIQKNDFVCFRTNISFSPTSNKDTDWVNEFKRHDIPIKVPEKISQKLAFWMGIYSAKGHINVKENIISFKVDNKQLEDILIKITKDIFDLTPDVVYKNNKNYIVIYSANLMRFIRSQFGSKNKFKKIPNIIQVSSLDEQYSYFIGLSYKAYQEKNSIIFSFNSLLFTNSLISLLKNLGFIISKKTGKGKNGLVYYINIVGKSKDYNINNYNILDIIFNNKVDINKIKKNYLVRVPDLKNVKIKESNPSKSAFKRIKKENLKLASCYVIENWNIPFESEIFYRKIVEVVDEKKETTEISLKNNGGIVVENLILFE